MTVSPAIRQNFVSALLPVISAGMLLMPLASFAAPHPGAPGTTGPATTCGVIVGATWYSIQ